MTLQIQRDSFGQELNYSEFDPITRSNYEYELRVSYEGIIGCKLIIQIDSIGNSKATFSEYAYKYSLKHLKKGDHSKDKFVKMDFEVADNYLEDILDLKNTVFPKTDSLECYSEGLDGNSLTIEIKDHKNFFNENYWEHASYNKDCLTPFKIEEHYNLLMKLRKEFKSESLFIDKLKRGCYGTYGESYLTK